MDKVIKPSVANLSNPSSVERLGALGVQYAVVHNSNYFGSNPVDELQWMGVSKPLTQHVPGLKLVKKTPTAQVFKVTNNSALMVAYPDPNEKERRPWLSNTVWKWQTDKQRIYVVNAEDKRVKVTLSAKSSQADGIFRVSCKKDNEEGFRQLQWINGRVLIPDVECAGEAETIIEVSFPNEIGGEATVWSELSVDIVPMRDLDTKGTFSSI